MERERGEGRGGCGGKGERKRGGGVVEGTRVGRSF